MPKSNRSAIVAPTDTNVVPNTAPNAAPNTAPAVLRPYTFHGVDLAVQGGHAVGDCPFCGRDGKFSVDTQSGLWRCFGCGEGTVNGGGNALVFIRQLYEHLLLDPNIITFREKVAADRRLAGESTAAWGIVQCNGSWIVPGYSAEGRLDQLYRRTHVLDQSKNEWQWLLLPTPGLWPEGKVHTLHMPIAVNDFDLSRPDIVVCEGPWDGMALWDVWDNDENMFGMNANIVAVPGCNIWRDEWSEMCRNKNVVLLYDSDHPRREGKGRELKAGYDGMARVAKRLSGIAASVKYIKWGKDGYDPSVPSGWDVRDVLTSSGEFKTAALEELFKKVENVPREWFVPIGATGASTAGSSGATNSNQVHAGDGRPTEAIDCSSWEQCETAWDRSKDGALEWRQDMSDALAVLLAVCASTQQAGNQLFLDLVGAPGSAKTTICRGLLTSHHCIHLENITKLMSGYRKADDPEKDCSFLARANGKTWVTCELDVILNTPQYNELMSKIRRIFDGETTSTYANTDQDRIYAALRTPWIRAGTPRMMDHDQSQLGDRFLRYIIKDPNDVERRAILKSALRSERAAILESANGTNGSTVDPKTRLAHAYTGGYVNWLRANIETALPVIEANMSETAEDYCIDLAELCGDFRAKPNEDKRKPDAYSGKELATRLARQNLRLADCLAFVLNKKSVDSDVLRIVRKVALDTAAGHSLSIAHWLCSSHPHMPGSYQQVGGLPMETLAAWAFMSNERMHNYLMFLRKIDVLTWRENGMTTGSWFLTERVHNLYRRVVGG